LKEKAKPGLDQLIENVVGLAETYVKLLQLEFKTGLTNATALVLVLLGIVGVFSFGVFFLSLSIAFYLSAWLELAPYMGFLLVALFYFAMVPLVIYSRRFLRSVIFRIVNSFTKNT
jgi:hypothetical protein